MRIIIYLTFIFVIMNSSLYSKTLFIESSALVRENYLSESSADVVYNFLYIGDRVYVYNFSKNDRLIIKSVFSDVMFLNKLQMFFYRFFFASKSIFYVSSEREVSKLERNKIDYIQVYFADKYRYDIDTNNLLKLENIYGKKILLAYEIREYIKIEILKDKIIVIDGDTIAIDKTRFRLLGIDAPEIKQEYGDKATEYLRELINKAIVVSISPADFDIYGRILAHLHIDNTPVAYSMIENKLAFQTITSFGDNGFVNISSNIFERARKQGKMPFINPDTYRDRINKGQTNNLTVKKQPVKKIIVKKEPKNKKSLTKKAQVVNEVISKKSRVTKSKLKIAPPFDDNIADFLVVEENNYYNRDSIEQELINDASNLVAEGMENQPYKDDTNKIDSKFESIE